MNRYDIGELTRLRFESNFEVVELTGVNLDHEVIHSITAEVIQQYTLMEKDGYRRYKAICLQSRLHSPDPLYEGVEQVYGVEVEGEKLEVAPIRGIAIYPTEIGVRYGAVLDELNSHFQARRGRILLADSGFEMRYHSDGPMTRRFHIPVISDGTSYLEYRSGNRYHMIPGRTYLVNAQPEHRVVNPSGSPRVHITFAIPAIGN